MHSLLLELPSEYLLTDLIPKVIVIEWMNVGNENKLLLKKKITQVSAGKRRSAPSAEREARPPPNNIVLSAGEVVIGAG